VISLAVLLSSSGWISCVHDQPSRNHVIGFITPEYFQFKNVVAPPDADETERKGGWRAVCIHAQLNQGDSGAKTICKFEVGVPIRNRTSDEEIPLEEAQEAAADMANRAARDVLARAHAGEMLAVLCLQFKQVYRFMLREKIDGSRVGECVTRGIETVPFGISLGGGDTP
jgi:hypothetical protein